MHNKNIKSVDNISVGKLAACMLWIFLLALASTGLAAKSPRADAVQDYIIQLDTPGAAKSPRFSALYVAQAGGKQVPAALATERKTYLQQLRQQREQLLSASAFALGHELQVKHEYEHLLNGFAAELTADEAQQMAALPGVLSVFASRSYELHLDAGPALIGAPDIWNGVNNFPTRGEGVVIGIIDSGINWQHPFFVDVAEDGFAFSNPLGSQLGLCSNPQVQCNNKLIGVYDFTTEGEQVGRDLNGHGSHVASIAAGNRLTRTLTINGLAPVTLELSGVAQRANIISYKACQAPDDAPPGTSPGCQGQAMLDALDQALADGVDVFNFSIGGDAREDPWLYLRTPGLQDLTEVFLDLRENGLIGVVSAGNSGPLAGSISAPANGPWSPAVGNITHGRAEAKTLELLIGGATPPPTDIIGVGASNGTLFREVIVHAKDFGNALCGSGPAELGPACGDNTGASNPFPPGTFDGEIVLCDRGTYGRVEKGKNLELAGAGGMILANTDVEGESIISDQHCLPAMHVGVADGDALRSWLDSGSGHRGRISATEVINDAGFAGQLATSSSVGPNAEIAGVLKPNLPAPGSNIIGASSDAAQFLFVTGTSMSAPHITGAFALLKAANPDWSNNQVLSALETTSIWPVPGSSTPPGISADQRGAGVPVLADAVRAGLFLDISRQDFRAADPTTGGNPQDLNLHGIQLADCLDNCQTSRTLTDMQGGGQWTLSTDQPFLQVSPASINLAAGQSADITISASLNDPDQVGIPQSGRIILAGMDAEGAALTQTLPVSVLFTGGDLPTVVQLQSAQGRDKQTINLSALVALPQASWQVSRLKRPTRIAANLGQDSNPNDPFDSNSGTHTEIIQVPADTLRLQVDTLASTADDVDLFVGQDSNGNGQADEFEEVCRSITFTDIENCTLDEPQPGSWWIRLQVFTGSGASTDLVEADYTVLDLPQNPSQQNLFLRAPGVTASGQAFTAMLAWDAGMLRPGQTARGMIGLGTSPENANNVGLIPVEITRTSLSQQQPTPLFDGRERKLTLAAGVEHDQVFIDVTENVRGLDVFLQGVESELQVVRVPFDEVFSSQPDVLPAPEVRVFSIPVDADNNQLNFTVPADALDPGRWYLVPRNNSGQSRTITLRADLDHAEDTEIRARETAYTRDGSTRQGVDFGRVGTAYGLLWYTFDEQGQPIFYNFSGPVGSEGRSNFHGGLGTATSDGQVQQRQTIGYAGATFLNNDSFILSYDLLGRSGSELMQAIAPTTCPQASGSPFNVHGVWDILPGARGGVSMLASATSQGYIRYFFDDNGQARWVSGVAAGNIVDNPSGQLFQAQGFCPDCTPISTSRSAIGTYSHSFDSGLQSGEQIISFELLPPLSASIDGAEQLIRLSDSIACED